MYSAVDLILSFLFFTKIRIHVAKANGRKIKSPAIPKNNEAFWKRAEDGTRTRDPNLGKVMLYQLSYFRIVCFSFASAKVVQIFILPNIFGEKFNYGCKFYYRLYRRHIV